MEDTFYADGNKIRILAHEPSVNSPAPAIMLLHGARGNAQYWVDRLAPMLTEAGVALYAPIYFDRTATSAADLATITDGVHFPLWIDTVKSALRYVVARKSVDPTRVALLGNSLGGFLALALAAELSASQDAAQRGTIRCLVNMSGGLPEPYRDLATPSFPPTFLAHGALDNIVQVDYAFQLDQWLTQLGVQHETHILPNEGHWFSDAAQMELLLAAGAFLHKHLQAGH